MEQSCRKGRRMSQEYRLYFLIIYVASLPGAAFRWALKPAGWTRPGRIHAQAVSEARVIAPIILSA